MAYFTPAFNKFMKGLSKNNNKDWFDENRKTYQNEVKKPWENFLTDLINGIREFDDIDDLPLNKFTFRINRDIRFSKDKTPYNPWVSAAIMRSGKKDPLPGYYIRLGIDGLDLGGGMHHPDKEQTKAIRQAIMEDGKRLHKLIKAKAFVDLFDGELHGEKNKVLPKEFKEAAQNEPLLFNKAWHFWKNYPAKELLRDDLLKFVVKHFKAANKVNAFFKDAVEA